MKTRISIHQMKHSTAIRWLETIREIAANNRGKLRLVNRRKEETLDASLLSLNKKELSFDLSIREEDFCRLLRWGSSLTHDTSWYLTVSLITGKEGEYTCDRYKVSDTSVTLIATHRAESESALS